jgi:DNA-directed RNA polymerase specialized sigma54-like protein
LSRSEVRRIGLSFQDLQPAGLSAHEHLKPISALRSQLAALEESKERIEGKRLKLLAESRSKGLMDDYELASLSGLNHEHLRRMTRGVKKQHVLPGPLHRGQD